MITFLDLEYFLIVAEELNFSKAAQRIYISQQAMSSRILDMERKLGVRLFERTRPLSLTFAGRILVKRAKEILLVKSQTLKELTDLSLVNINELAIGVSYAYSRILLPKILPTFMEIYPNVKIKLLELNAQDLDKALIDREIDMAVGRLPFLAENIEVIPLREDKIVILVPDQVLENSFGTPALQVKQQLKNQPVLHLLKGCPFILTARGRVRNVANIVFQENKITPKIVIETETFETATVLCYQGLGILFSPEIFLPEYDQASDYIESLKLNVYPLSQPRGWGTIAIGYLKNHYLSLAMKGFIDVTQSKI